jgi:hypothetical protein
MSWLNACALCLLVVAATSNEVSLPPASEVVAPSSSDALISLEETAAGALYWRVRSVVKVPLEGWVLSKIQWFETQDGSGDPDTSGEPIASSFRGSGDVPPNTEFAIANAVDGSYDTVWESEDGEPGQWFGVKFAEKKDIKAVVMRTPDMVKGPAACMVEKSEDGENWGRVAELNDMRDWGVKDQLFKLVPMDLLPPSVFSIRSQFDTAYCVGVRTRMEDPDDEDSPIIHIEEGAVLELQKCLDDTVTQWWSFDVDKGRLHNAADEIFIADVSGDLAAGSGFAISICRDGCPDATASEFMYSDSVKGGFVRSKSVQNLVFHPKDGKFEEGVEVTFGTCGSDPDIAAELDQCPDNRQDQWELLPMFAIEEGKHAIKCAPYSHTLATPDPATTRQEAQRLCAADIDCSAYNWANGAVADPQEANKVYECHKLHDVHPGVDGWELGIRAGRAYDSPYKERSALM